MLHQTFATTARWLGLALVLILPPPPAAAAGPGQEPAPASPAGLYFAIASQPLDRALEAFIEITDWQIGFPSDLSQGLISPGVSGTYAPEEALARLLAGSGLTYRIEEGDTVRLEPAPQPVLAPSPPPEPLAQATPPPEPEATELPEMTVTASPLDATSYSVPNASTATKTDTPIMETPVSIQVVPQQVLKDQQVIRLDKALRNVSGVYAQPFSTNSGFGDSFNIRGFSTDTQYRNGMPYNAASGFVGPQETANLERIEVLKGPASILFGRIEPGGLINLVPKQPLDRAYYSLQQQLGSFDFYRTTIDATGPLMEGSTLGYRLNLAYENSGSFRDLLENDRVFVAPVVRWNISDRTQVTFELEYKNSRDPLDIGVPALDNRPVPVPRESYLGERGDRSDSDYLLGGFNWSHAFNDSWTLRHAFYASAGDALLSGAFGSGLDPNDPTSRTLTRIYLAADAHTDSHYTTLDLTGKFNTWGMEHTLLLGGDYSFTESSQTGDLISFTSIDLFQPIHVGAPTRDVSRSSPQAQPCSRFSEVIFMVFIYKTRSTCLMMSTSSPASDTTMPPRALGPSAILPALSASLQMKP